MGDAADDMFAAMEKTVIEEQIMLSAGCRRCPEKHDDNECPICLDLGWLDPNNNPCEP